MDMSNHHGSANRYHLVPKIMKSVREHLEERDVDMKIRVVCFLDCPEDESVPKWEMPGGWNEASKNRFRFDQRLNSETAGTTEIISHTFHPLK